MATNLQNNVTIDEIRLDGIQKKAARPRFTPNGNRQYGNFHFSTANKISQAGALEVAAVTFDAQVDMPAAMSDDDFAAHNVRFTQAIKVHELTCHYAGTRNSEGSMTYRLKEPFINSFILDCTTNDQFLPRAYPFFAIDTTARLGRTYVLSMNDSPGFNTATRERNATTDRWNYIWKYKNTSTFFAMLVFQYKNGGPIETIGTREWTLEREAVFTWRPPPGVRATVDMERVPSVKTVSNVKIVPNPSLAVTGDPRDFLTLGNDQARVMNKIGNEAQSNFRTSPNMWFKERTEYAAG